MYARATLPSPRLHGAARGLRARSAPRAATGACPTTIRDVLRVQVSLWASLTTRHKL